jgi:oligopeptide transport system substrate-binding protein
MFHYEAVAAFRFHVQEEPMSLDPLRSHITLSSYVLNIITAPLMQYQDHQLKPFGADHCDWKTPLQLQCHLRQDWVWSDQKPVEANQIVESFQLLFQQASARADHFLMLKNALAVLRKEKPVTELGVRAVRSKLIEFDLSKPDAEFLYRLIDPVVSPRRSDVPMEGLVSAGPYVFEKRIPGRSLHFKNNKSFFIRRDRPDVEVLIVESDETALGLFEKGQLNFHRRLPLRSLRHYESHPGLIKHQLLRFDYIGMGPDLDREPRLREGLIYSLQPQLLDMVKLFAAAGPGGCVGLSKPLLQKPVCLESRPVQRYSTQDVAALPPLSLTIATQSGDAISQQAELFQSGWQKNLGVKVEIKPEDLQKLEAQLRIRPPSLFRRGVNLERPTCLAALELFRKGGANNFIRFENDEYEKLLIQLSEAKGADQAAKLCERGARILLQSHKMIPLGEIQFYRLSDQKFDGFRINELNQLDLTLLATHETTGLKAVRPTADKTGTK